MAPERLFETAHVVKDLKRLVLQGGLMKILSQAFKFGLRVAGLVVMARLVTPGDYGIFAMVATLTGLLAMLKDAGLQGDRPKQNDHSRGHQHPILGQRRRGAALAAVTDRPCPGSGLVLRRPADNSACRRDGL